MNDIVLAQDNTALVSASSDVTVKVWRPHDHDASVAQTIGAHSDYVKCLANSDGNANWVASGGLDHKICVWDLNGAGQTLEINVGKAEKVTKGSIYALCARGSVLASGGPESVVRLWDQKSGKCITKLVGHTDNIRDILMSEDGDMLLSASSDQTVKVWSVVAGRCMHTLTMHNESVWCMYSDDPRLSVFYSADRSGLVAKTDVRHAEEFDEGLSVAICQDHEGVSRIIVEGEDIWTASSSSSINRWKDVDTEAEIETPPSSPQRERTQSALSQEIDQDETDDQQHAMTNGVSDNQKIPYTSILRLSVTAPHPAYKASQPQAAYSPPSIRKASEVILEADPGFVIPIRNQPVEVIEGQNGLIKHVMLNDRKRVLTLDTAGEVVLWDLLKVCELPCLSPFLTNPGKCVPIRSYGKQDIENVVPEVNTMESIANWCAVDTRTGKLSVRLEENYCFDAEVYADEIDIPEKIDFREDQRINLGKWVLRNLFTTLLDEEIKRDEEFRKSIRSAADSARSITRNDVPGTLALPVSNLQESLASPDSATTPRATNSLYLATPGLPIGVATPAPQPGQQSSQTSSQLPSMTDEGEQLEKTQTRSSQPPSASSGSHDYFSSKTAPTESDASVDLAKQAATSGMETQPTIAANPTSPLSPEDKDEKKKSGLFGKKFQMNLSKTLGRKSADVKQLTGLASGEEGKSEATSDKSSDKEPEIQTIEDNFFGVVQRIRQEYREQAEAHPDEPLTMGIHASLPIETPVLKQPPHTMVIIQEDNPESGGLADMYRGEICNLGREADLLERIAPMWLGQLLLKVSKICSIIPFSFAIIFSPTSHRIFPACLFTTVITLLTEPHSLQRHHQSLLLTTSTSRFHSSIAVHRISGR